MAHFSPYVNLIGDEANVLASPYLVDRIKSDREVLFDNNALKVARRDGEVLISWRREVKTLIIEGLILGAQCDQEDLEAAVDELKRISDIHGGKVVINYASGYRTYLVNVDNISITRESDWHDFAHFAITYKVYDPPFGLDSDANGNLTEDTIIDVSGITEDTRTIPGTFTGTVEPKPKIKLTFADFGDVTDFEVANTLTGEALTISPSPSGADGDVFQIDTGDLTVQRNAENIDFTGVIPKFKLGINPVQVNLTSSTGTVLAASQTVNNLPIIFYGSQKVAQSVNLATLSIANRLALLLSKVGTPTGDVTVRIETNSGSSPSGTLVNSLATFTITASQFVTTPSWITNALSLTSLSASTVYWIVVSTSGGDVDNYYQWHASSSSQYANGSASKYDGVSWVAKAGDQCFRLYKASADQSNEVINYDSVTEDFTTTARKDAGNTTGDWNTSIPCLTMVGANANQNDAYTLGPNSSTILGISGYSNAIYSTFVPTKTGTLTSYKVFLRRNATTDSGVLGAVLRTPNNGSTQGTLLATSSTTFNQSALTTNANFQEYTFVFNDAVVAGTSYDLGLVLTGSTAVDAIVQFQKSTNGVVSGVSYTFVNTSGNVSQVNANTSLRYQANTVYTSWATPEQGQTIELDTTVADIVSISHLATTSLSGTGTYQGAVSVNNGTDFQNVSIDATLFATDTIPTKTGQQIKWRGTISGSSFQTPRVNSFTLGWKKGLIIEATTKYAGQSFQVATTANRQRLDLYIAKLGTPGDITVRIETDTAGSPSGTLVNANATKTLTAASLTTAFSWISFNFPAAFSMTAATTYWIVVKAAATVNDSNKYLLQANNAGYSSGAMKKSVNSGGAWTSITSSEDLMFRLFATSGAPVNYRLQVTNTDRFE